ncbi:uncharacterized protein TM35_000332320 [Trypanosoma theileri]|uniref:Uncharacterized protein n=1 Tax=Trypanosoma theileri TaxID=67003 RepID=A0A1X0NM29_9TRYP|nr:uncharacterized protein TM35_000332320 [Trypanosoma theileri]ORC85775.1 hypothetical protein TM35_000332320 [Trypanosoma theileri]
MESKVSHAMCATGVRGESLFPYYFFLKIVRWRLSRLNRGLLRPQGQQSYNLMPGSLGKVGPNISDERARSPTAAVTIHRKAGNRRLHVRIGGFVIQGFRGSAGRRRCVGAFAPHMISEAKMRAVNLAFLGFKTQRDSPFDIRKRRATAMMYIMQERNTYSPALVAEAGAIESFALT